MNTGLSRRKLVLLALVTEGVLTILALFWVWVMDLDLMLHWSMPAVIWGLGAVIPLLVFNFGIFASLARHQERFKRYREFLHGVVCPLCTEANVWVALVVSACAGIGEELFFRVALQGQLTELVGLPFAMLLTNVAFAAVHFGPALRRYWRIALVYTFVGINLSALLIQTGSVLAPALTHAVYNFVAIVYIRYFYLPSFSESELLQHAKNSP